MGREDAQTASLGREPLTQRRRRCHRLGDLEIWEGEGIRVLGKEGLRETTTIGIERISYQEERSWEP